MLILGDQSDSARRAADSEKRPCSPKGSLFALNRRVSKPPVSAGLGSQRPPGTSIWSTSAISMGRRIPDRFAGRCTLTPAFERHEVPQARQGVAIVVEQSANHLECQEGHHLHAYIGRIQLWARRTRSCATFHLTTQRSSLRPPNLELSH